MKVYAANNEEINLKDTEDDVMPSPRIIESEDDLIKYAENEGNEPEDEEYDDEDVEIDDIDISENDFDDSEDTDDLFDDDDDIDKILKEEMED